jgi:hypothetical protein
VRRLEGERRGAVVVGVLVDDEDVSLRSVTEFRLKLGRKKFVGVLEVGDAGGGGDDDGGLGESEDVGELGGSENGVGGGELYTRRKREERSRIRRESCFNRQHR